MKRFDYVVLLAVVILLTVGGFLIGAAAVSAGAEVKDAETAKADLEAAKAVCYRQVALMNKGDLDAYLLTVLPSSRDAARALLCEVFRLYTFEAKVISAEAKFVAPRVHVRAVVECRAKEPDFRANRVDAVYHMVNLGDDGGWVTADQVIKTITYLDDE